MRGSSDTLKRGTVFKNIRLIEDDEESIECGSERNFRLGKAAADGEVSLRKLAL